MAWLQVAPPATSTPIPPTPVPTVSLTSAPPTFPTSSTNLWSQGALDALSGIWTGFFHWAGQTIQYVEDWATETLGFMWVTPAALTYKNGVVQEGVSWIPGLMDGLIMLILVVGGYQCLIRTILGEPRHEVMAFLSPLPGALSQTKRNQARDIPTEDVRSQVMLWLLHHPLQRSTDLQLALGASAKTLHRVLSTAEAQGEIEYIQQMSRWYFLSN